MSVGILFPTDIFLFAQINNSIKLNQAEKYLSAKEIDSSFVILDNLLKDTLILNKHDKAELFYFLTIYYKFKNKEDVEIKYNKKAELLYRQLKNEERLSDVLFAKFELLKSQNNLDTLVNPIIYLDESYKLSIKKDNKKNIIRAIKGHALIKLKNEDYVEAFKLYEEALNLSIKIKDSLQIGNVLNNMGLALLIRNSDSARSFYRKALKIYKKIEDNDGTFNAEFNIGISYLEEKDFLIALKWFKKVDSIPLKEYKFNKKRMLYGRMSDSYEKQKDYKNALDYVWLYNDYKDSVDLKAQNIAITDQQIKYKSLEKEKKNIELTNANKRKQLYLLGVVGASLGLFSFGFLSYRNVKKKKEIAEKNIAIEHQKFVALVKDQELISMDSMIEGQEKERKRIAEDLHDNLGSTLATLKLHFDNYRAHLSVDNVKQIKMLNSTENILDEAYNKVRTMAHANQASILAEHSLVEAVKSLAYKISSANKTEIEVIDFGFDKSLNHSLEIAVFRIIQELITNIVKHANAKKATIDLTLFEDSLGLIVEDDGQGFNIEKLENKIDGMGLNSIKNRIEHVNGSFIIDTSIGKGTSILIDIPVNKNEI